MRVIIKLFMLVLVQSAYSNLPSPTITYPLDGATNISPQASFEFTSSTWATKIEYLISDDVNFNGKVLSNTIGYSETYSINSVAESLPLNNTFYMKFRHLDSLLESEWSSTIGFTTIGKPTVNSPTYNEEVYISPEFNWLGFFGDVEIQICEASNSFSSLSIISNTIESIENKYNWEPVIDYENVQFDYNTEYKMRIRQIDDYFGNSQWSDIIEFSTINEPLPSSPGPNPNPAPYIAYLNREHYSNRDITENPVVRKINGSLNVSSSGAAQYTIPIWVPKGRNGIEPKLSLSYNSQSGPGIAGWGWNLTGLSSISRIPRNKFKDGEFSELEFNNNDILSLDGVRLIPIQGLNGEQGTVYVTEVGNSVRVTQKGGDLNDLETYFEIKDKQGNLSIYGKNTFYTPGGKIILSSTSDPNVNQITAWRISEVNDVYKNFMYFIYDASEPGNNLISRIEYTGSYGNNGGGVLSPLASIEFMYGQKAMAANFDDITDQMELYSNGLISKDVYALTNIIIKKNENVNGQFQGLKEIKKFKLEYFFDELNSNYKTQLLSIGEFGELPDQQGEERLKVNETVFEYYNMPARIAMKGFSSIESIVGANDPDYTMHFGDFNGDGIKDRLIIDRFEEINGMTHQAVGHLQFGQYFECDNATNPNDNYCEGELNYIDPVDGTQQFVVDDYVDKISRLYNENITIADINRDGKDDLILPFLSQHNGSLREKYGRYQGFDKLDLRIYSGGSDKLYWGTAYEGLEINRSEYEYRDLYHKKNYLHNVSEKFLLGDYNSDGFLELVYQVNRNQQWFYNGQKNNRNNLALYYLDLVNDNGEFFNDQLNSYQNKIEIYSSMDDFGSINDPGASFHIFEAELNGYAELLFTFKESNSNSGVYQIDFDPNGDPTGISKLHSIGDVEHREIMILDINGDKYSDILYQENKEDDKKWYVEYWEGSSFSNPVMIEDLETHNYFSDDKKHLLPGDFNGDGKMDLLKYIAGPAYNSELGIYTQINYQILYNINNETFKSVDLVEKRSEVDLDWTSFYLWKKSIIRDGHFDEDKQERLYFQFEHPSFVLTDLNGDGNSDIYNYHGDGFLKYYGPGKILLINPDQHSNHLKSITDGFGNKTEIIYKPISSGSVSGDPNNGINTGDDTEFFRKNLYWWDNTLNNGNGDYSEELIPMNQGVWAVSSVEKIKAKTSGPGIKIDYTYGYSVFHKDIGFLGFKEFFIKTYDEKGYTQTRDFHQVIENTNNKIYSLVNSKTQSYRNSQLMSEVDYASSIETFSNNNYAITNNSSLEIDYFNEVKTTSEIIYENDSYPNMKYENPKTIISKTLISKIDDTKVFETEEITNMVSKNLTWETIPIFNKIGSTVEKKTLYDEQGVTVDDGFETSQIYDYYDETKMYALKSIINDADNDIDPEYELKTSYDYDIFGNITSNKSSYFDQEKQETVERWQTFQYDDFSYIFLEQEVSSIGVLIYEFDQKYHKLLSETDIQGNKITYLYDKLGRKELTTDSYGNQSTTELFWYNANSPLYPVSEDDEIVYYSISSQENSPDIIIYYDGWGNKLRTENESFRTLTTNDKVIQKFSYYPDGRTKETSYPHYSDTYDPLKKIINNYDDFIRLESVNDQGRITSTEYHVGGNPRIQKSTSPDSKTNIIQKNEIGLVTKSINSNNQEVKISYKSDLKTKTVETIVLDDATGLIVSVEFDEYGRRKMIDDKDAGDHFYYYNLFGELERETNSNGETNFTYDNSGRVKTKTTSEGTFVYEYYEGNPDYPNTPQTPGVGKIHTIQGPDDDDIEIYQYDQRGNIIAKYIQINGKSFNYTYSHNHKGQLESIIFPSGVELEYIYDNDGFNTEIKRIDDGKNLSIWKLKEMNEYASITKYEQIGSNNNILNEIIYDEYQLPDILRASTNNGVDWDVQNWDYDYNELNGNLKKRYDEKSGQTEEFQYDNLDRLYRILYDDGAVPQEESLFIDYLGDGSIKMKTDLGDYFYKNDGTNIGMPEEPYHAVKQIKNSIKNLQGHKIETNSFNSVKTLTADCDYFSAFEYGVDNQRNIMKVFLKGVNNNIPKKPLYKKYYLDDYELKEYDEENYSEITYINTPIGSVATIINLVDAGVVDESMYFLHLDFLGSLESLSDETGQPIQYAKFSYDAWGQLRDPDDWYDTDNNYQNGIPEINLEYFNVLSRGFTGHEHLIEFELINMNGRVYDQSLGQFIQPDNNISFPENAQSYNRYSYVLNNPLKYTDPSGENPFVYFAVNAVLKSVAIGIHYNNWDAAVQNLAIGVAGAGIGMVVGMGTDYLVSNLGNSVSYFHYLTNLSGELTYAGMFLSQSLSNISTSLLMSLISDTKYSGASVTGDLLGALINSSIGYGARNKAKMLQIEKINIEYESNRKFIHNLKLWQQRSSNGLYPFARIKVRSYSVNPLSDGSGLANTILNYAKIHPRDLSQDAHYLHIEFEVEDLAGLFDDYQFSQYVHVTIDGEVQPNGISLGWSLDQINGSEKHWYNSQSVRSILGSGTYGMQDGPTRLGIYSYSNGTTTRRLWANISDVQWSARTHLFGIDSFGNTVLIESINWGFTIDNNGAFNAIPYNISR